MVDVYWTTPPPFDEGNEDKQQLDEDSRLSFGVGNFMSFVWAPCKAPKR